MDARVKGQCEFEPRGRVLRALVAAVVIADSCLLSMDRMTHCVYTALDACIRPRQTTVSPPLDLSSTGASVTSVGLSTLHVLFFDADKKKKYNPPTVGGFRKDHGISIILIIPVAQKVKRNPS